MTRQTWFDSEARFCGVLAETQDEIPFLRMKLQRIRPQKYKGSKYFNEKAYEIQEERYTGEHLMLEPGEILHLVKTLPTFDESTMSWSSSSREKVTTRVESFLYKSPTSHIPVRHATIYIFNLEAEL